jgi:hypothetical protein
MWEVGQSTRATNEPKITDMDKLNRTSILARLKGKTPLFWKQIRKISAAWLAVGVALLALPAEQLAAWMPAGLPSSLITIGTVGVALSSLTVESKPEDDAVQ